MDRDRNRNRKLLRAAASDGRRRELHRGAGGGVAPSRSSRGSGPEEEEEPEEAEEAAAAPSGTDSDDSDPSGGDGDGDGGARVYRCTQCDESFGSWRQLELHSRRHVGEQRLRCHLCSRRFRLPSQLKQHLNTHLAQKPHACPDCGKTFLHKSSVRYHQLIHAGAKPHGCGRCGRRFRSTSQRKVHMCAADAGRLGESAGLRCAECGEMFGTRLLLTVHERVHQGKRLFTCSFCGVRLLFRSCLEKHLRSHTGERPFGCAACHKRFRWASQVKNHKCAPPPDAARHACPECGAAFPSKAKLLVHLRGHQGKKLYTCSVCGLQYQYKSQAERHTRSHTGEKLFGCSVCRRRFAHVGTARQHQLMHAQEKPFRCGRCGRSFAWRFQIKKHRCQSRVPRPDGEPSGPRQGRDPDPASEPPLEPADGESWRRTRQVRSRVTYQRKKAPLGEPGRSRDPDQHVASETRTGSRPPPEPADREGGGAWRRPEANNQAASATEDLRHVKEDLQEAKASWSTSGPGPRCARPAPSPRPTFSCSMCGAAFADTDALILHTRSHARRTRFSCSVCGKDFSWRRHLTKHLEVHRTEDPEVHRTEDPEVHAGEEVHQARLVQHRKVPCRTKPGRDQSVRERTPPVDSPFSSLEPNEVKQENQEEPSHVKEELQEVRISQTSCSPVPGRGDLCGPGAGHPKSEDDEKPCSVLGLHQTYLAPGAGLREGPPESSETDVSDEDWTDRRGTGPAVCREAAEDQDSEDSDFWKDGR